MTGAQERTLERLRKRPRNTVAVLGEEGDKLRVRIVAPERTIERLILPTGVLEEPAVLDVPVRPVLQRYAIAVADRSEALRHLEQAEQSMRAEADQVRELLADGPVACSLLDGHTVTLWLDGDNIESLLA